MLIIFKLLVLALSITVSLARPQDDVEAVTSLEALLEDSSLEAGDIELDQDGFLTLDEDPVANTTPEDEDTAIFETTPDPEEVEAVTEAVNLADNLVEDEVIPQLVLEEEKEVTLKITEFSDSKIVFRESSPILGLGCEAASEVDSNIRYMWTKNGRFIDTANSHVTFETSKNGNLIIYSPGSEDEGVYQCVVSNSEGVVFSRVAKVRMIARRSRARALDTNKVNIIPEDRVTIIQPVSINGRLEVPVKENVFVVMPKTVEELDE